MTHSDPEVWKVWQGMEPCKPPPEPMFHTFHTFHTYLIGRVMMCVLAHAYIMCANLISGMEGMEGMEEALFLRLAGFHTSAIPRQGMEPSFKKRSFAMKKINRDLMHRINRRAHELARLSFEDFQRRMLEDSKVIDGHTQPEDWQPSEKTPG